jgi:hypothetical protein
MTGTSGANKEGMPAAVHHPGAPAAVTATTKKRTTVTAATVTAATVTAAVTAAAVRATATATATAAMGHHAGR